MSEQIDLSKLSTQQMAALALRNPQLLKYLQEQQAGTQEGLLGQQLQQIQPQQGLLGQSTYSGMANQNLDQKAALIRKLQQMKLGQ